MVPILAGRHPPARVACMVAGRFPILGDIGLSGFATAGRLRPARPEEGAGLVWDAEAPGGLASPFTFDSPAPLPTAFPVLDALGWSWPDAAPGPAPPDQAWAAMVAFVEDVAAPAEAADVPAAAADVPAAVAAEPLPGMSLASILAGGGSGPAGPELGGVALPGMPGSTALPAQDVPLPVVTPDPPPGGTGIPPRPPELPGPLFPAPVLAGGDRLEVAFAENGEDIIHQGAVTDRAPEGLGWRITGGADAALLFLDPAAGTLRFRSSPDFERPGDADGDNLYEVVVEVRDGWDMAAAQRLSIRVTDVEEPAPLPVGDDLWG